MENFQPELRAMRNINTDPENEMIVGRHFEDVDDLTYNLDAPLKPLEEESIKMVDSNAQEIIQNTEAKKSHKILMISSSRKRAMLTSKMFKECIQKKRPDFSVHIQPDNHFAELYQGKIILPENYHKGDRLNALVDAWRVFWTETFTNEGEYNNPNYRFGDPLYLKDDLVKYPELVNHFSSHGESYRELCLRYYQGLLNHFENRKRLKDANINVILIAHGALIGILSGLEGALNDIKNDTCVMKTGDLMKICWQKYQYQREHQEKQHTPSGGLKSFSLEGVDDNIVNLLRKEINFLRAPENYGKND
jgi:broad specificity phosphatase PhoE